MSIKEVNEITVKIKCGLDEISNIIESKGFNVVEKFTIEDVFFVPEKLNVNEMSAREILSKAVLIRDIKEKLIDEEIKRITFKIKNYDENGEILSQKIVNCGVLTIGDAKDLLIAIGYTELMRIKEEDTVYEKNGLRLSVKDIVNGYNLIEIETGENEDTNTIEKLIRIVNDLEIPVYTNEYFVKKAEIELDKVLGR